MKGWPKVFAMAPGRIAGKIAAPFVVPFLDDEQRLSHPVWGCRDATDLSWWNIGVRNGVHNWLSRKMPKFDTDANTEDWSLELEDGFQWRRRRSHDREYVSFRCTWGKPRPEGKREFYIGWKMNEVSNWMNYTFFQFRIF